ncbi:hypothetical protein MNV_20007 [Candidatus Methanoperedens nitroreducens]|uniref:Uncharacterized protein n=1 Tax=Candidatus Methanoperedens nitratireducens TaxID=1392998 RepID=A0A284VMW3_9EURY|nr:hypothetical protein MNV_20007 [Candidatus Methanoperedens nitroreducens]
MSTDCWPGQSATHVWLRHTWIPIFEYCWLGHYSALEGAEHQSECMSISYRLFVVLAFVSRWGHGICIGIEKIDISYFEILNSFAYAPDFDYLFLVYFYQNARHS